MVGEYTIYQLGGCLSLSFATGRQQDDILEKAEASESDHGRVIDDTVRNLLLIKTTALFNLPPQSIVSTMEVYTA